MDGWATEFQVTIANRSGSEVEILDKTVPGAIVLPRGSLFDFGENGLSTEVQSVLAGVEEMKIFVRGSYVWCDGVEKFNEVVRDLRGCGWS